MRDDGVQWLRVLALTVISTLGLVTIVGSGGGASAFFTDCPSGLDCSAPTPSPAAEVQPPYITTLVGTSAAFAALPFNFRAPPTYQWSRSSDGGATYVDIIGATASTYRLATANLADDQTLFRVTVRADAAVAVAVGHLVVSATPSLVFADGELGASNWSASPVADANEPAPVHTEETVPSGGNPGSYRAMVFQLTAQASAGRVFYTNSTATYQPQNQGAIYVIDYAEDCIALASDSGTYTLSSMSIEQGGRQYVANNDPSPCSNVWGSSPGRSSLRAQDFRLFTGPACAVGESCPDFSAVGAPMRFGYWRISYGLPGSSIGHGIDNWKVSVWRR